LALTQAHQPGREDVRNLAQALVGGHQIGRQRIAARKASIELVGSFAGALVHPAAVDLLLSDSDLPRSARAALALDPAAHGIGIALQLAGDVLD
jgi:hypothetical protein